MHLDLFAYVSYIQGEKTGEVIYSFIYLHISPIVLSFVILAAVAVVVVN